jgi:hypothetical protein
VGSLPSLIDSILVELAIDGSDHIPRRDEARLPHMYA